MTAIPDKAQGDPPPGLPDELLEELESLLTLQISAAACGNLSLVEELGPRVDEAIASLQGVWNSPAAPAPAQRQQRLAQVRQLQQRLSLALAAGMDDCASRLSHLGNGKRTLRAYHS